MRLYAQPAPASITDGLTLAAHLGYSVEGVAALLPAAIAGIEAGLDDRRERQRKEYD